MMEKLYLVARIAETRVALRSRAINSVVTLRNPEIVPGAPPHVAGLFALRSRIFTLIDPHVVVGLPAVTAAEGQRVIVVDVADHGYALITDEIEDVRFINSEEKPIKARLAPGWAGVADAVIEYDGASLLVVDPSNFVTMPIEKAA